MLTKCCLAQRTLINKRIAIKTDSQVFRSQPTRSRNSSTTVVAEGSNFLPVFLYQYLQSLTSFYPPGYVLYGNHTHAGRDKNFPFLFGPVDLGAGGRRRAPPSYTARFLKDDKEALPAEDRLSETARRRAEPLAAQLCKFIERDSPASHYALE